MNEELEEVEEVEDYNDLSKRELLEELHRRGLTNVKGPKPVLVAALEADDQRAEEADSEEAEEDAPDPEPEVEDPTAAQPDLAGDVGNGGDPASAQPEEAGNASEPVIRSYRVEFPLPVGGFNDAFHMECIAATRQEAIDAGYQPRGSNVHSAHRVGMTRDGLSAIYEISVRRQA